jgi:hypothetical protein
MDIPAVVEDRRITEEFVDRARSFWYGELTHVSWKFTIRGAIAMTIYGDRPDAHQIVKIINTDPESFDDLGYEYVYLIDDKGGHARLELSRDGSRMSLRPLDNWID